tara:strand:+ start:1936 stop:3474 length:1539 start_codon:yes stop_codon:yes gene_type:complete
MKKIDNTDLVAILEDPIKFCSRLKIVSKGEGGDAKVMTLDLTSEQIKIINTLMAKVSTFILKPRQIGATTVIIAFLFWLAYMATSPIVIVLLAHKLTPAKKLLKRIKFMYDNMPKWLKPPLSTSSTTELIFEHNGAGIYAATGQGDGGVRSETIHYMHITEINFTPNAEELLTTAKSAVNKNPLILESTANHQGDPLYQEIQKYRTGKYKKDKYKYLFFSWLEHIEYETDPTDYKFDPDEREFQASSGCSLSQLAWRQDRIIEFGYDKFRREYPTSFEEAYRTTGNTYFNYLDFVEMAEYPVDGTEWTKICPVDDEDTYAVGVDVGGGVGKNYTVVYVVSKRTNNPCLIWRSNEYDPIAAVEYVIMICIMFNNALLLIESNNHGLAMINEVMHNGYMNLWKDEKDKHFLTTFKSKNAVFSTFRKDIRSKRVTVMDETTREECLTIIDDHGVIKFGQNGTAHCDNAMAAGLAHYCLQAVRLKPIQYLPDWINKKKADKIRSSSGIATGDYRRY